MEKILHKMSQYFPKPCNYFGTNINVKVFNYATKIDLNAIGVDTSILAPKPDLDSSKAKVDRVGEDKLNPVLVDLSKLSNAVHNDVVKKTVYNKSAAKVNYIISNGFLLKTKYDADKSDLEKKISDTDKKSPDTSGLAKKNILMPKLLK